MRAPAALRRLALLSRLPRCPEPGGRRGKLGAPMPWAGCVPQLEFAIGSGLGPLRLRVPSVPGCPRPGPGCLPRPGAGQGTAHFALLLLVGVVFPELAARHRLGERCVRADAAASRARWPVARPNPFDGLQGAPPMPGLNRGATAAPTRAQAFARVGEMRFKPSELLALHG